MVVFPEFRKIEIRSANISLFTILRSEEENYWVSQWTDWFQKEKTKMLIIISYWFSFFLYLQISPILTTIVLVFILSFLLPVFSSCLQISTSWFLFLSCLVFIFIHFSSLFHCPIMIFSFFLEHFLSLSHNLFFYLTSFILVLSFSS